MTGHIGGAQEGRSANTVLVGVAPEVAVDVTRSPSVLRSLAATVKHAVSA